MAVVNNKYLEDLSYENGICNIIHFADGQKRYIFQSAAPLTLLCAD